MTTAATILAGGELRYSTVWEDHLLLEPDFRVFPCLQGRGLAIFLKALREVRDVTDEAAQFHAMTLSRRCCAGPARAGGA